jgi:hypothetical protein
LTPNQRLRVGFARLCSTDRRLCADRAASAPPLRRVCADRPAFAPPLRRIFVACPVDDWTETDDSNPEVIAFAA